MDGLMLGTIEGDADGDGDATGDGDGAADGGGVGTWDGVATGDADAGAEGVGEGDGDGLGVGCACRSGISDFGATGPWKSMVVQNRSAMTRLICCELEVAVSGASLQIPIPVMSTWPNSSFRSGVR
jgi:hypothetical protein